MRSGRHAAILEIIANKEIETQDELCEELNKRNYSVTGDGFARYQGAQALQGLRYRKKI